MSRAMCPNGSVNEGREMYKLSNFPFYYHRNVYSEETKLVKKQVSALSDTRDSLSYVSEGAELWLLV